MASTSFGSQKKLAGKQYRDGTQGRADDDLRSDIDAGFVLVEAAQMNNVIVDPGDTQAIPVDKSGTCNLSSAGAGEARVLALPTFVGQRIALFLNVDNGEIAVTVASAFNIAGNTGIAMDDAGDHAILEAVLLANVLTWRLVFDFGLVLS